MLMQDVPVAFSQVTTHNQSHPVLPPIGDPVHHITLHHITVNTSLHITDKDCETKKRTEEKEREIERETEVRHRTIQDASLLIEFGRCTDCDMI